MRPCGNLASYLKECVKLTGVWGAEQCAMLQLQVAGSMLSPAWVIRAWHFGQPRTACLIHCKVQLPDLLWKWKEHQVCMERKIQSKDTKLSGWKEGLAFRFWLDTKGWTSAFSPYGEARVIKGSLVGHFEDTEKIWRLPFRCCSHQQQWACRETACEDSRDR